jgi:opacity protein-like surface antigen
VIWPPLFFLAALVAQAQPLSYGFKVGSPAKDSGAALDLFSTSLQSRWTGGPTVELHLPWRLSVEFDALYRSGQANRTFPLQLGQAQNPYLHLSSESTKTWDLPLLLKHRFSESRLRPLVTGGVSWSYRRNQGVSRSSCLGPQGSCRPPDFPAELFEREFNTFQSTHTRFGAAAGAGVEFQTEHVAITPEVRWNQWSGRTRHQFTVMVGFTFGR